MSILIHKEIGENAEDLAVVWDTNLNAYVVKSQKSGSGNTYPLVLRREDTGGLKFDTAEITPIENDHTSLGSATHKFANVYTVLNTVGDLIFDNSYVLTEPDNVYEDAEPGSGLYLMNDKWEPIAFWNREGDLIVKRGLVINNEFPAPTVKRRDPEPKKETKRVTRRKQK